MISEPISGFRFLSSFHRVQNAKAFVGATITITQKISFFFQIEDCGREAAAFFARKLWKFSENFGSAHGPSN